MSYSVWWIASIFSAVILFMVAHFVASERDKALKRRPRLPDHLQDEKSLQFHKFPPTFFWGAATAAHQVEGGLRKNQWAAWENATRHDGQPACIHKSEDACNHWELFDKDLQLMSSLNLNMYRFSIEWSRIEPEEGVFDEEALLRYVEWCEKLQAQGIEPMVTLHHFTEPLWFHQRGGFETDWGVEQFARFAEQVVRALGPRCRYYVTVNEPLVYTMAGWVDGQFPPGKRDFRLGLEVTRRLLLAHARAYRVIKQHQPGAQVGLAKHVVLFEAQRWWFPPDALAAALLDESFNWAPLRACVTGDVRLGVPLPFAPRVERHHPLLAGTLDFVGVNHYQRMLVRVGRGSHGLPFRLLTDPLLPKSDFGWDVLPSTLFGAVVGAGRFRLPVIVTEHGTSDGQADDRRRRAMLLGGLHALHKAAELGVDVRGYLHWTLLDNFEWNSGYTQRFGLYRVDRATQRRTLTSGGALLGRIVRAFRAHHGLHDGDAPVAAAAGEA